VLISGESGTGKELVARALHRHSTRSKGPFITENCGAIPEPLLEATLFGHVRGAFTGAVRARTGLFALAHRGVLFLDEIGEMSLAMQTKLLRVLEQGEVRPVGSEKTSHVDVRIVAATHRNLEKMVAEGTFREDLYYRLRVIDLEVPPLRSRPEDLEVLFQHFVRRHAPDRALGPGPEALALLRAFAWPGNVRQLENEVRRILVLADDAVRAEHLSPAIREGSPAPDVDPFDLRGRVQQLELQLVQGALERSGGNQTRAAELLGVSRFGLQKMMKRLGIASQVTKAGHAPSARVTQDR
jgi:transcriptional regulator with PAS, ATPase and Fis domain